MKNFHILLPPIVILAIPSCCTVFPQLCDDCSPAVRYQSGNLLVEGVSVPGSSGATSVAKVQVNSQQLQVASQQVQIIDNHRIALCRLVRMMGDDPNRDQELYRRTVEQYVASTTAISQLGLALQANESAVAIWNNRYQPRARAIVDEVRKVESPAAPITPTVIADAAVKNPEVGTLEGAGNADYRASTTPPDREIIPNTPTPPAKPPSTTAVPDRAGPLGSTSSS